MGKNKGKGAANLRRINTQKKEAELQNKMYLELKKMGFPDVTFKLRCKYIDGQYINYIDKEIG